MSPTRHEDLEEAIRRCFDAGDLHGAATAALEGYGPEILGMLYGTVRDEEAVAEIFSSFTEDLWGGLGAFRWGCTFRTWAFRLAHNARHRHFRSHRPPAVPLSQAPAVAELAEQVRSRTHAHLRTSVNFDPEAMANLFTEGQAAAMSGVWMPGPPTLSPGDGDYIRTGLRMRRVPVTPRVN